jgi:hypothetical protein
LKISDIIKPKFELVYNKIKFDDPESEEVRQLTARLVKDITTKCSPWLEASDRDVFRGLNLNQPQIAFQKAVRQDRKPLNSPGNLHNFLNQVIAKIGGTANRNNSLFVTGKSSMAAMYGQSFVVFPVDYFSFTWSTEISDAFTELNDHGRRMYYLKLTPEEEELVQTKTKKFEQDNKEYLDTLGNDEKHLIIQRMTKRYEAEILNKKSSDLSIENFNIEKMGYKADTDLDKAIKSGHEIMLQCTSAIYVDTQFYRSILRYALNR